MPHATQDIFLYKQKKLSVSSLIQNILLAPPPRSPLGEKSSVGRGSPARCPFGERSWLDKRSTGGSSSSAPSTGLSVGALGPVKIPHKYYEVLSGFHIHQIISKLQTTDSKMLKTWEVRDKDSLDLGSIFSVPVVIPTLQVLHCPHFLLWLKIWQSVAPFICK